MPESRKPNLYRRAMMQGVLATAGGLALSQSESWLLSQSSVLIHRAACPLL